VGERLSIPSTRYHLSIPIPFIIPQAVSVVSISFNPVYHLEEFSEERVAGECCRKGLLSRVG